MSEHKKQHQIPKTYMKHFSEKGKMSIMLGENDNIEFIENIPYKNQNYENFYYGKDLIWEKKLGEVETDVEPIIDKIIEGDYSLSEKDLQTMRRFISYQIARVPSQVNKFLYNQAHTLFTAVSIEKRHKENIPEISFSNVLDFIIKEKKRETIDSILSIAEKNTDVIKDLDYLIVDFTTSNRLVFSDNPVIQQNDFFVGSGGLGLVGLIIILPLSPSTAFLMYDKRLYDNHLDDNHITSDSESDVAKINLREIVVRESKVFFDLRNNKSKLSYINAKNVHLRKNYLRNLKPVDFGSKDNKVIMMPNRYVSERINFSFLEMREFAKNIQLVDYFMTREEDSRLFERLNHIKEIYGEKFSDNDIESYRNFMIEYYGEE
ncbi:DUF4238 domain-containing protein [Candidatus Xianfuyuplasma coldseepsis]|uniref:DUF4238 domain-containing protein n=1 Tax=Candidatus Xianfuyuplasma coldseepsis TaxID=2782163 RepID=A0A7L7KPW1_9MOLU|nr:DUF4238 domain-containing protein [Xianfuyuplasma coldseepsis]QMS84717.1 DUF4238 domain-containing protein [Xianfuyuplasma coldseepsis]